MREEPPIETSTPSYRRRRYPAEIIAYRVYLFYRFPLSYH